MSLPSRCGARIAQVRNALHQAKTTVIIDRLIVIRYGECMLLSSTLVIRDPDHLHKDVPVVEVTINNTALARDHFDTGH